MVVHHGATICSLHLAQRRLGDWVAALRAALTSLSRARARMSSAIRGASSGFCMTTAYLQPFDISASPCHAQGVHNSRQPTKWRLAMKAAQFHWAVCLDKRCP